MNDPEQLFKILAASNELWAAKFRQHLKKDMDQMIFIIDAI
jgi:hypothetical protein